MFDVSSRTLLDTLENTWGGQINKCISRIQNGVCHSISVIPRSCHPARFILRRSKLPLACLYCSYKPMLIQKAESNTMTIFTQKGAEGGNCFTGEEKVTGRDSISISSSTAKNIFVCSSLGLNHHGKLPPARLRID